MNDPFDSRLANMVSARITEDILAKQRNFPAQIIRDDAAATGMNCAHLMGEVRGLEIAMLHLRQAWDEMHGKGPKKEKKD